MFNKKLRIIHCRTPEGLVFWTGVIMTLLLVAVIGYISVTDRELAGVLGMSFVAHTFGGRAAGIGLCIMNNLGTVITIVYNFYLEVLIVCFTYSLFVLSASNHIKLRVIRFYALKLERKARTHKDKIAKYGWLGLFVFVTAPLPVTGPVMGSIIGVLLKLKLWRNFSATFLGTLTAIIIWTVFFDVLEQHLHIIQYILGGIVVIIVLSYLKTIKEWLTK
jgi:uncharacterized membrane protein